MIHGGRRAAALLFLGDFLIFILALGITLVIRYGEFDHDTFADHLAAFLPLFLIWSLVFYMSGLYGKRILLWKSSLPDAIVKTQFFNILLRRSSSSSCRALGIAPKTNLVIYLVVSLLLIFLWRLALYPRSHSRDFAIRRCSSVKEEVDELVREVNGNRRYHFMFLSSSRGDGAGDMNALAERMREEAHHHHWYGPGRCAHRGAHHQALRPRRSSGIHAIHAVRTGIRGSLRSHPAFAADGPGGSSKMCRRPRRRTTSS
jgi:hypothetical protein